MVPARNVSKDKPVTEAELSMPSPGYPSSRIVLHGHEVRYLLFVSFPFGDGITFYERISTAIKEREAIALRTCYTKLKGRCATILAVNMENQFF